MNDAACQQHQESIENAIINTGWITRLQGSAYLFDYSVITGTIHAFTTSLAQNLVKQRGKDVPMQRPGQPEEVAPSYVFVASNADSS